MLHLLHAHVMVHVKLLIKLQVKSSTLSQDGIQILIFCGQYSKSRNGILGWQLEQLDRSHQSHLLLDVRESGIYQLLHIDRSMQVLHIAYRPGQSCTSGIRSLTQSSQIDTPSYLFNQHWS